MLSTAHGRQAFIFVRFKRVSFANGVIVLPNYLAHLKRKSAKINYMTQEEYKAYRKEYQKKYQREYRAEGFRKVVDKAYYLRHREEILAKAAAKRARKLS